MTPTPPDALVFFGATSDLASKKIFPALYGIARHRHLDVPVVAVSKSGWTIDQLRARAQDAVEHATPRVDRDALARLLQSLAYVDGNYDDLDTFARLRDQLGAASRPALPGDPAQGVRTRVDQLGRSGAAAGGRVAIEKPFGENLP